MRGDENRAFLSFGEGGSNCLVLCAPRAILLLSRVSEKKQPIDFNRLETSTERIVSERLGLVLLYVDYISSTVSYKIAN